MITVCFSIYQHHCSDDNKKRFQFVQINQLICNCLNCNIVTYYLQNVAKKIKNYKKKKNWLKGNLRYPYSEVLCAFWTKVRARFTTNRLNDLSVALLIYFMESNNWIWLNRPPTAWFSYWFTDWPRDWLSFWVTNPLTTERVNSLLVTDELRDRWTDRMIYRRTINGGIFGRLALTNDWLTHWLRESVSDWVTSSVNNVLINNWQTD